MLNKLVRWETSIIDVHGKPLTFNLTLANVKDPIEAMRRIKRTLAKGITVVSAKRIPDDYVETLPIGERPFIQADAGSVVSYINEEFEIEAHVIQGDAGYQPGRFIPHVDRSALLAFKAALRVNDPDADELWLFQGTIGFFLCTIRFPV